MVEPAAWVTPDAEDGCGAKGRAVVAAGRICGTGLGSRGCDTTPPPVALGAITGATVGRGRGAVQLGTGRSFTGELAGPSAASSAPASLSRAGSEGVTVVARRCCSQLGCLRSGGATSLDDCSVRGVVSAVARGGSLRVGETKRCAGCRGSCGESDEGRANVVGSADGCGEAWAGAGSAESLLAG